MTELKNIFQTKIKMKKTPKPKIKIFVDYREKNCFVPTNLMKLNFDVEFRELKVADYLVKNIAIERKSVEDFLSSMKSKRLINQIHDLQQYENKLLIVEGIEEQELYDDYSAKGFAANSIRGFLLSITMKHKIPLIFTKNQRDTAKFIAVLANKKEKESSLNVRKKSFNKKEQMQFILEGFPGIGPKTAKKLLEEFKSIKEIINSPQEKLKKCIGKKAKIFELISCKY
jgi:Fanconi anemia group M protein